MCRKRPIYAYHKSYPQSYPQDAYVVGFSDDVENGLKSYCFFDKCPIYAYHIVVGFSDVVKSYYFKSNIYIK